MARAATAALTVCLAVACSALAGCNYYEFYAPPPELMYYAPGTVTGPEGARPRPRTARRGKATPADETAPAPAPAPAQPGTEPSASPVVPEAESPEAAARRKETERLDKQLDNALRGVCRNC